MLKGSLLFAADLIRQIDLNTNLEFLDLSSYKGSIRGELVLNKDIALLKLVHFYKSVKSIMVTKCPFKKIIVQTIHYVNSYMNRQILIFLHVFCFPPHGFSSEYTGWHFGGTSISVNGHYFRFEQKNSMTQQANLLYANGVHP